MPTKLMKQKMIVSCRHKLGPSDTTNPYKSNENNIFVLIPGSLAKGRQQGCKTETANQYFGSRGVVSGGPMLEKHTTQLHFVCHRCKPGVSRVVQTL